MEKKLLHLLTTVNWHDSEHRLQAPSRQVPRAYQTLQLTARGPDAIGISAAIERDADDRRASAARTFYHEALLAKSAGR